MSKVSTHQKYRLKDGTIVPGTTTIVDVSGLNKYALMYWAKKQALAEIDPDKVRDVAAEIGTVAHALIEEYIHREHFGQEDYKVLDELEYAPKVLDSATLSYEAFLRWEEENHVEYEHTELQLVSEEYRYGGTLDIVAKLNGEPYIIDLKTSKGVYPSHIFQIAGYRHLYTENFGEERKCSILRLDKVSSIFDPHPIPTEVVDLGFEVFERLLFIHSVKDRFNV